MNNLYQNAMPYTSNNFGRSTTKALTPAGDLMPKVLGTHFIRFFENFIQREKNTILRAHKSNKNIFYFSKTKGPQSFYFYLPALSTFPPILTVFGC